MKAVLLAALLLPAAAHACAILGFEAQRAHAERDRQAEEQYVLRTAPTADSIVSARVASLTPDPARPGYVLVALSEPSLVRGSAAIPATLDWRQEVIGPNGERTVKVGCIRGFDEVSLLPGYRYLMYVKDGRIVRATVYDELPHRLTGAEEQALLQGSGH